jgi:hypothetical protein
VRIARVSPERENELRAVAQQLEADLRYVGLEAVQAGDCFSGSADLQVGFVVYYDPSAEDDESAGVFVRWRPSSELLTAAAESGDVDSRPVVVGGVALDAMLDTLQKILQALGWQVEAERVGIHESSLKVTQHRGLVDAGVCTIKVRVAAS